MRAIEPANRRQVSASVSVEDLSPGGAERLQISVARDGPFLGWPLPPAPGNSSPPERRWGGELGDAVLVADEHEPDALVCTRPVDGAGEAAPELLACDELAEDPISTSPAAAGPTGCR